MRPEEFTGDAPGILVQVPEGWAFTPVELPPTLTITRELLVASEAASLAIGRLVGQARLVQNLDLVTRPLAGREAILSSKIEGTQTEIKELLLQEASPQEPVAPDSDLKEVMNYLAALALGQQWFADGRRLSPSLIKDLHARLLAGTRGDAKHPGSFRRSLVYVGNRATGFHGARFVPPPPEQVEPLLDELVAFARRETTYGPLIDCALLHYQFETIHPFEDGNGRIGRLLIPLYLLDRGVLDRPVLYLSAFFETHRDEYVEHLLRVSTAAAWEDWVFFFLEAIRTQAEDAGARVQRFLGLREEYTERVRQHARSRATLPALELVLDQVFASVRQVADFARVSVPTAKAALSELAAFNIVGPYTSRVRGTQYWFAHELLDQVYEN